MLEIGSLVDGKYKILNKVGQGGMSVVYLAMNEKANKQWAVKEVRKDGIKDFEVVKQGLVAETDILKKLSHPSLPSIIDVIDTADSFIIIMDYIQGNSLNKALDEYGALPQDQVIQWAKQLCDVLGYLHTRNPAIIYRDMKPANIMLKPDGNITLIDFGTAREFKEKNLADTTCLGTVGYAAPEQFGGMGQTDARTDIYCLGATLYHLVTGMNPCEPPYEIKPIRQINPTLSSGLEKIILKCTQRDPNDRYQSAAELMYALEHYDEIDDIYRKKQKRKLGAFITTSALTLIFTAVSVFGFVSYQNKKKENYDYLLKSVSSTTDFQKVVNTYYEAIALDPTRTEAYLGTENGDKGLIEFLVDDGVLESSEATYLQQLRSGLNQENSSGYGDSLDAIDELRKVNQDGYQDVCYEIGQAYLFNYEIGVSKDKYSQASNWFQYAKTKYPVAQIYCDIAECVTKIAKYGSTEQYSSAADEYKVLWNQLKTLKSNSDEFDTDLKVRVWNEIINMLNEYTEQFSAVVSSSEISNLIYAIDNNCSEISDNVFVQESLEKLENNIETLRSRLDAISNNGN